MGCHKALLPFRGGALVECVAQAVREAAGSAVLVGHPRLYRHLGYPAIPDLYPGTGPLGGILTAFSHTSADWNLVTACDMPGLSAEFLRGLIETATRSAADAIIPLGASGRPEPLCAVYHRRSLPVLERAMGRGVRSVRAAVADLRATLVPVPELSHFQNVNTPEDWANYAPK
jgi:molybdopterin-guanine dinucleotide biosynthesis protein A